MISQEKKIWSEQEDETLRKLFQEEGMRNWSTIAKRMWADFNLPRKSAKQCRERYENHINLQTLRNEWTLEQQMMLIKFHNEIGNKWSQIAQKIPGKTDNCVKNHFYSKLRKILRKLNTIIHSYFRREFREININVIYKIVEACEELFKEEPNCEREVSQACREVQNKMLNVSMLKEEELDSEARIAIYREVIKDIYAVNKMYKRKSKKTRNSNIQAPTFKIKAEKVLGSSEQGYQSDPSSMFDENSVKQEPESPEKHGKPQKSQKPQKTNAQKQLKIPITHQTRTKPKRRNQIVVMDQEQGIREMLKDAGLLKFEQSERQSGKNQRYSSSARSSLRSGSQNLNNDSDQQFFDDSDFGCFSKSRKRSCFKVFDDSSEKSQRQHSDIYFY